MDNINSEELEIYFQGRKIHYQDPKNKEVEHNREQILNAMKIEGADYFSLNFEDVSQAHFILYDADKIIGSAELWYDDNIAQFSSGHVSSEYWGNHLSDLLYEAREAFISKGTTCKKLSLKIRPDNIASQKAAVRNGFMQTNLTSENKWEFEKKLG
ncbi:MAG: GNAT family N-acetyltransferase [Gelidibacter sp.]|nr:GNAT family N-acetyltransferase [Gelidibacter sp.]